MSFTQHVFPSFALGLAAGKFNFGSDTLKCGLSDNAGPITLATTNVKTAALWTDWKSNVAAEISGTGYTAGGATLSGESVSYGGTNNDVTTFTFSNPSWTSASFTANQAIFYDSSASTYQLICFWDFGGALTVTSGTFTLGINASGLMTATCS